MPSCYGYLLQRRTRTNRCWKRTLRSMPPTQESVKPMFSAIPTSYSWCSLPSWQEKRLKRLVNYFYDRSGNLSRRESLSFHARVYWVSLPMVSRGLFNSFSDEANVSRPFRTQSETRDFILVVADEINRSAANPEHVAERRGQSFLGGIPMFKEQLAVFQHQFVSE